MLVNLKKCRLSKGFTQAELSKLIGYDQTVISQWEHGSRDPNTDTLLKLSEILGVSSDELITNQPKNNLSIANQPQYTEQQKNCIEYISTLNDIECLNVITYIKTMREISKNADMETLRILKIDKGE